MIKRHFILCCIVTISLVSVPNNSLASTDVELSMVWENVMGGVNADGAFDIIPSPDGGFLLVGATASFGAGDTDGWIVKIDNSGTQQWNRTYGGENYDSWSEGFATSDGYIVAGISTSLNDTTTGDGWAAKIDFDGHEIWNHTYGWKGRDEFFTPVPGIDGGYVFGGVTKENDAHTINYWIVKTDTTGNLLWNKTLGQGSPFSMVSAEDGYALFGVDYGVLDGADGYLVKTDTEGEIVWTEYFDVNNYDICENIIQTSDKGFLIGCNTDTSSVNKDALITKLDRTGAEEWNLTLGNQFNDFPNSLLELSDGGYLISIHEKSSSLGSSGDNLFVKLSSTGSIEWKQTIGYSINTEFAWDMIEVSDGIVVCGIIKSKGAGDWDLWVFKLQETVSSQNVELSDPSNGLQSTKTNKSPLGSSFMISIILIPILTRIKIHKVSYYNKKRLAFHES